MVIEFTVYGQPATAGSKRAFPIKRKDGSVGVRVTDDNRHTKSWQQEVASAAAEKVNGDGLLDGPLEVHLTFTLPRLKSHFGTGRNSDKLKLSAPLFQSTRPDALKLARAVEDALTGVIWRDDAQIAREVLEKRYGDPVGVHVIIRTLDNGS